MHTKVYIRGTGSFLPDNVLESTELEKRLDLESGWIESKTGVAQRRIATDGECVSDLAAGAAKAALADAGMNAHDLDLLILATSMGDMFFPSTACIVQDKIGAHCPSFDVLNACSGFLYALSNASAYIKSGACRNVLVVASETLSRMVNWSDYRTCILFGDGAGAFVLSSEGDHELVDFHLGADGSGAEVLKLPGGGSRNPASEKMLTEGMNTIYMQGGDVFRFAMKIIGECVQALCKKTGVNISDIATIVPHQSNMAIIKEAARILDVPVGTFYLNLPRVGNTASASVPIAFNEAAKNGRLKSEDHVAMVSYGAGLAYASALVKW